jgi:hypothetical protein
MERLRGAFPGQIDADAVRAAGAMGLLPSLVGDVQEPLRLLLGAVALVLMLACANLANLLLARGERRRQEIAVRAALGAQRARLIREQLAEGTVLALAGGLLGTGLAALILGALRVGERSGLPRAGEMAMDGRVLLFALAASLLSVIGFALLPALRVTRGDLRPSLGAGRRAVAGSRSGRRIGATLIALEVAIALVVVSGAGLLLSSLRSLRAVAPGLDAARVLAEIALPTRGFATRAPQYYDEVLRRRGVTGVGAIHLLPFTEATGPPPRRGHAPPGDGPPPAANFRVVTPDTRTVGIQLLDGRDNVGDVGGSEGGLINAVMASTFGPERAAVGRTIQLFGKLPFRVGVVANVHQQSLDREPRVGNVRT